MSAPEPADARPHRSLGLLLAINAIGLLVVAILLGLGLWQVQRRAWKLDLIARVEARVHAEPGPPPGPAAWPAITAEADAYRHLRLTGIFRHDRTTLVQALTEFGGGFWVLTPLVSDAGFTVLVNRGFVPSDRRDPADRAEPAGPVTLTGLLRVTEPGGAFLRSNDPTAGRWFWRDVVAIARARGLADVAPYFVDADAGPDSSVLPIGGLTIVAFPNSHLIYALTWFVLAAMSAGALVYLDREALGERRRARGRSGSA